MMLHKGHSAITVEVKVTVDATGKVTAAEPVSAQGALAGSLARIAAASARLWTFKPALYSGRPMQSVVNIRFNFDPSK